jgi:hypothetical protein
LKEYVPHITVFIVEIGSDGFKWGYSAELKKHIYLSKDNHLCLKQENLAPCFLMRTEVVLERIHSTNQSLEDGRGS